MGQSSTSQLSGSWGTNQPWRCTRQCSSRGPGGRASCPIPSPSTWKINWYCTPKQYPFSLFWSFVIQATLFFCKINEVSWIWSSQTYKTFRKCSSFHRSVCMDKLCRSWIIIKQEMSNFLNLQPILEIATQIFMAVCKKIFMVLAISRTQGLNNDKFILNYKRLCPCVCLSRYLIW